MRAECFIHATLGPGVAGMCDGPMQRAHLIPKEVIKRELRLQGRNRSYAQRRKNLMLRIVWNEALWRWMCEKHHHMLDFSKKVRLQRKHIPAETEEYVAKLDGALVAAGRHPALGPRLDREYGLRDA